MADAALAPELLDDQGPANELLKFFTLHELFRTNEQHKGTVRCAQQRINFIDANVAVFCGFADGEGNFLVDGDGFIDGGHRN